MTIADSLLFSYDRSHKFLHLMTGDLTPAEWLKRPVEGANHAAWIVGHLIVVERTALKFLNLPQPALPSDDFAARHGKGSMPSDVGEVGDVSKLVPLWDEQRQAITEAIKTLPADGFDHPTEHPMFKTVGQFLTLVPGHAMLHIGHLSTIRRSLGKPPAL